MSRPVQSTSRLACIDSCIQCGNINWDTTQRQHVSFQSRWPGGFRLRNYSEALAKVGIGTEAIIDKLPYLHRYGNASCPHENTTNTVQILPLREYVAAISDKKTIKACSPGAYLRQNKFHCLNHTQRLDSMYQASCLLQHSHRSLNQCYYPFVHF